MIFRKYTNWFQPAKCNESLTNNNQLGLKHYPHHHQNCLTDCSTFTFNILQTSNPSDPSDIPDQSDPSNQLNQSELESESEKTKTFRIARFLSQKLYLKALFLLVQRPKTSFHTIKALCCFPVFQTTFHRKYTYIGQILVFIFRS